LFQNMNWGSSMKPTPIFPHMRTSYTCCEQILHWATRYSIKWSENGWRWWSCVTWWKKIVQSEQTEHCTGKWECNINIITIVTLKFFMTDLKSRMWSRVFRTDKLKTWGFT
jgi:hypothetical protein